MQNGPKWVPKWSKITKIIANWWPKATKMHPKGSQSDQGTSKKEPFGKVSIFDAKKGDRRTLLGSILGAFLVQNPLKTRSKNHLKIDTEKVEKMREKTPKMEPEGEPKSERNGKGAFMKMVVFP